MIRAALVSTAGAMPAAVGRTVPRRGLGGGRSVAALRRLVTGLWASIGIDSAAHDDWAVAAAGMKLSAGLRVSRPPRSWNIPFRDCPHDTLHHAVLGGCWDGHLLDVPVESPNSLPRHTLPVLEVNRGSTAGSRGARQTPMTMKGAQMRASSPLRLSTGSASARSSTNSGSSGSSGAPWADGAPRRRVEAVALASPPSLT
jgi:hypothetical protein